MYPYTDLRINISRHRQEI